MIIKREKELIKKNYLKIILCIILSLTFSTTVFAGNIGQDSSQQQFKIEFNIDDFDIMDYQDYFPLLHEHNINLDEVIGIYIPDNTNAEFKRNSVPAGILILKGTHVSPSHWKMTVQNVGFLNITKMEADVQLISRKHGLLARSQRYLGKLDKLGTVTEDYFTLMYTYDIASCIITGTTSDGEWFNTGGSHIRN